MDDLDIRWKQRFENLRAAFLILQQAVAANAETPDNDLIRMALIKAFEMTFDLSWKTLKDYLHYNGIDAIMPREVIKQSFANDLVADGQLWIEMLEDRNLMAHVYDEARALAAVERIRARYLMGLEQLQQFLGARLV
ncbi:nucleotidyltransferase substrate binding protein [uncultured Thiocystis sp.]|jgi:nucleotidyltransferase substrate binding protein (TIGR01987 family)|uniref:nucleotidyltransferase substrate binding protein n=1 Tax=uncultured Thiocystis sp. TaxID=1202134 RepID=UPI0025EC9655|nr:nucleotidyltransferase substrate binding protein [uncultured Thiocystis sp.]